MSAKRNKDIAARLLGFVVTLLGTGWLALQTPEVQTGIARKALQKIESRLQGTIQIGSLSIEPLNSFKINNIVILDKAPFCPENAVDTLFSAETISGKVSPLSLLKGGGVYFSSLRVQNALFHLAIEPDSTGLHGLRNNIQRIFGLKKPSFKGYVSTPDIFHVQKLYANGINFRLTNYASPLPQREGGFNWSDLDIKVDLSAHSFKYTGGRMSGVVDRLSAQDKCGYTIKNLTGKAKVGMGKASIEKIHLVDEWSDIKLPLFSLGWDNPLEDFYHYVDNIRHELVVESGVLSAHTIHAFAPIPDYELELQMGKSHAKGYISDLQILSLRFTEPSSKVAADLSATLTGITDAQNLLTNAQINNLTFTSKGAEKLLGQLGVKAKISGIAPERVFSLKLKAKGPLNKLNVSGHLGSRIGRANFSFALRGITGARKNIVGSLNVRDLGLGEILGQKELGELTAETGFKATIGKKSQSIVIDSLLIDKLGINGYNYTGLRAQGSYSGSNVSGRLICADPNLNFMAQGSFRPKETALELNGNIAYANLQSLGLDKRGKSVVSASFDADFQNSDSGTITISGLGLENQDGRKNIGDIIFASTVSGKQHMVNFHSDFASGEYFGNHSLKDLPTILQDISTKRELSALYPAKKAKIKKTDLCCELSLRLADTRELLSFLSPGLYVADSTALVLEVDQDGALSANLHSSLVLWHKQYLKNLDINFDNFDGSLNALLVSDEINFGDLGFSNAALTAYAKNNSLFTGFSYDGVSGMDNMGELYITGELSRGSHDKLCIDARPLSSFVRFSGQQWNIDESRISWTPGSMSIDGFRLYNGTQSLSIDGGLADNASDTLAIDIKNVDLSVINYFTTQNYDISGRTSGTAVISSPTKKGMHALGFLNCDSLMVSGLDAGTIRAAGVWDSKADKVNLYVRNIVGNKEAVKASGIYHPSSGEADFKAELQDMNLVLLKPFVGKVLSDLSGSLTGTLYASGAKNKYTLSSQNTGIKNARIKVAGTGVTYTIDGPFHINNEGLFFDDILVTDSNLGRATLSGGIKAEKGGMVNFNTFARLSSLELLNLSSNDEIGGHLSASGRAFLSGPPSALLLDAELSTEGNSNLHIPLGSLGSSAESNLLSFTNHQITQSDPVEDILKELLQKREERQERNNDSDFMARLRINATQNTEAILDLDNSGDNRLRFRGVGNIGINLNSSNDSFDISGDYNISEGSYRFSVPGVSKDFTINSGSSISFGGDILETNLDIGATYTLRTSLGRLIADTSSVNTRREVQCGIRIADKLRAPSVSFSVDIADLEPSTKAMVESALNTEDKIQKQFIALLVTGSFLPSEQSGIVNNPNILYSNVSEIMSRQLSDMLLRLNIPLDMGLGYQQNRSGTDLFDVALSTQLFNNRVEVHGSVGNRQNRTGTAATPYGDVVGDLDIDWKINPSGQLRLNAFSHSADEYSSYLDNTQRNGAGISYQKEFGTWKEFFRSLFMSKSRREQIEAERSTQREEQKKVIINE